MKLTNAEFISRANTYHNNRYDYSLTEYKNNYTKVKIICKEHGVFEQVPCDHLRNNGCSKCSFERQSRTLDQFIQKAMAVHGNKYDYSSAKYKNLKSAVNIICPEHGMFSQLAYNHLRGKGCLKCGTTRSSLSHESNTSEFIEKSSLIHNGLYSYSNVNYIGVLDKVEIICAKHGSFYQTPNAHLNGQGCPKCCTVISSGHQEIADYISSFTSDVIINDRDIIKPLELDIWIPSKRIALEYHGLWYHSHGQKETVDQKLKHYNKYIKCRDNDIRLIQIFENEWRHKKDIVKSRLAYLFGKTNRIYARKCDLCEITLKEYSEFMSVNHIQGSVYAPIRYGLKYEGQLVSVASFNRTAKYDFELIRFANLLGHSVIGGAGRLLDKFCSLHPGSTILSYADVRYSDGNLYRKLGFQEFGITNPNYFYFRGNKVYSRHKFQKHKLHKILKQFDEEQTEYQNMFNNGYRRFWDAGHFRFVKAAK